MLLDIDTTVTSTYPRLGNLSSCARKQSKLLWCECSNTSSTLSQRSGVQSGAHWKTTWLLRELSSSLQNWDQAIEIKLIEIITDVDDDDF